MQSLNLAHTTVATASGSSIRSTSNKDAQDGPSTAPQSSVIPGKPRDVSVEEKKEKHDSTPAVVGDKEVPHLRRVEAKEGTSPPDTMGSSLPLSTSLTSTDAHKSILKDGKEEFDSESYHSKSSKSAEMSPKPKDNDEDFDSESYHSSAPKEKGVRKEDRVVHHPPNNVGEVATPVVGAGMSKERESDKEDEDDFSDFSSEDLPLGEYIPSQMSITSHDSLSRTFSRTLTPHSLAHMPKSTIQSSSSPVQAASIPANSGTKEAAKKPQDELSDWDSDDEGTDDRLKSKAKFTPIYLLSYEP